MIRSFAVALVLAAAAPLQADWRADLRAHMNPQEDVEDVLDARGTVFDHPVGEADLLITWASDTLSVSVEGAGVPDLDAWYEATDPPVIAFSAYGALSPALLGWLYLDDMGDLRMELEVDGYYARYVLPESGTPLFVASKCRCRKVPLDSGGCTNKNCDETASCPLSPGHFCEWTAASAQEFETAFEGVVTPTP